MNIELKSSSREAKSGDLKDAKTHRSRGDSEIKTSCITCKFKPNCEDAIPFYTQAAEIYHGASAWNDEIYCRDKLTFCYHTLKSLWEEGNEREKVAFIYLDKLDNKDMAYKWIQNAYLCFFQQGEYKDAVNALKKLGQLYLEKDDLEYAEKCLKGAYEAFLQVFHTLATKKDEPYDFLYAALDIYLSILHRNNKVKLANESCQNVIKVIEQFEEKKTKIIHVYGLYLLGLIIVEDDNNFNVQAEAAKNTADKISDRRFIENIDSLYECIRDCNENQFGDCMIEINVDYPIEVTKKLNEIFLSRKKMKKPEVNMGNFEEEAHIVIVDEREAEKDDYL